MKRKSIIYTVGILVLGIVVFNNTIQTIQNLTNNPDYITAFWLAMIGSAFYAIINLN